MSRIAVLGANYTKVGEVDVRPTMVLVNGKTVSTDNNGLITFTDGTKGYNWHNAITLAVATSSWDWDNGQYCHPNPSFSLSANTRTAHA